MGGDIKEEFDTAFRRKIRKLLPSQTVIGKVDSVDTDNYTCVVKPVDGGPDYFDVRLQAIIDDNDQGVILIPKEGSSVLVSIIENDENNNYISQYSELDEFIYKIDELEFSANTEGVCIKNKDESFKQVMNDMFDLLLEIVIVQGNDLNKVEMTKVKNRFNKIIK